ncbi:thiolase family protein [Pelagibaculum spongiae]|uniref:Acetyl-CoA C-acetyltransferase n=1 Tax=Pelagibaculum spongiae TaxID=2080658 RepID=A0A2V1GPP4_9GAMM|nr:acetyl-CoA C-acyltransferase [Pelagibaculum spongiae]PVZ64996.1 acetyl-CoA C-acetyltransferase [Pelagibaculum spongiae]
MKDPIVIVSGVRTPMGAFQGALSSQTAPELGGHAIHEAVERACIKPEEVDEVIMGCVLPAGTKQGPARQAMQLAHLPNATGAITINKLCGSGMKAIMQGCDSILAESNKIVVAGGMESMSNAPHLIPASRNGFRMGHGEFKDHMFYDGLEDPQTGKLMGVFAQQLADEKNITREQMDDFAINSLKKAKAAIESGVLRSETVPVIVKTRKGEHIVINDEQPETADLDKVRTLRPAFRRDGTVTAANSSSISDGASAVVLMRESEAFDRDLQPLARITGYASHSQDPEYFTTAPVGAVKKLLEKTGWSTEEVDLWEINEAFAIVTMYATHKLGLDESKVNIHGGACAQGHPVGSSGSRIVVSLIHALKKLGKHKGVATLCIGGGEATAIAVELYE